ncbi:MAG: hypothetical protein ABJB34_10630 [Acidobacteriota bacterium]
MKYTYILLISFALIVTSNTALGQKFVEKPYKEWTKEDVLKLTSDSPWATQYQSERGLAAASMEQQARDQAGTRLTGGDQGNLGRPSVPVPIYIRLFSALPIRQAMVRQQQIGIGYDKMSAEDKKKFDDGRAKFLECGICKEYYVVTLTKWKDTSTAVSQGIFEGIKAEELKGKIWLVNDKGQKLDFTEFTPPKNATDAAVFFFKRNDASGSTFFSPSDKAVKLVFANELRDDLNAYSGLIPKTIEFKVAKMVVDGKLVF